MIVIKNVAIVSKPVVANRITNQTGMFAVFDFHPISAIGNRMIDIKKASDRKNLIE